jgi:hypothetical protein
MRRLQVAQLHDEQEQEDADRQIFNQEILSEVPRAHGAQGRQNFLKSSLSESGAYLGRVYKDGASGVRIARPARAGANGCEGQ